MLVFEERRNRSTRRKPLAVEYRTNKFNPHMTPSLGIEPGPHWWEAKGLTTAASLHPMIKLSLDLIESYQFSLICFLPIFYIVIAYPFATLLSPFLCSFVSAFFLSFSFFCLFLSFILSSSSSLFDFLSYPMFDFVWLSFSGRPCVLSLSIFLLVTLLVSIFNVQIFLGC